LFYDRLTLVKFSPSHDANTTSQSDLGAGLPSSEAPSRWDPPWAELVPRTGSACWAGKSGPCPQQMWAWRGPS